MSKPITKEKLEEFVRGIATSSSLDDGFDMDEALEMIRAWVHEAREMLGISICDDCGEDTKEIVGCPDGAEICKECFDAGRH